MQLVSTFGDRLAQILGKGSMQGLADKLGVSKQSISAYVNKTRHPKRNALVNMANTLNVNPAWLMGYDVPMKQEREKPSEAETIPEGMTRVKIFHRDGNTDYADFTPEQMKLIEAMMKSGYKKAPGSSDRGK